MGSPALLIGEKDLHGGGRIAVGLVFRGLEKAKVVGVGDSDVSETGRDCADLVAVATLGRTNHVFAHRPGPRSCRLGPVGLDHGGHERLVVDVRRRTRHKTSAPFRVGEVFVGREFSSLHPVGRINENAGALRQGDPLIIGITQSRGDFFLNGLGCEGLQKTGFLCAIEPAAVGGHVEVGGGVRTFLLQAHNELVGRRFHDFDRDPGLFGKETMHGLIKLIMTLSVEREFLGGMDPGGRHEAGKGGEEGEDEAFLHEFEQVCLMILNPVSLKAHFETVEIK